MTALINKINELKTDINIPMSISEFGVSEAEFLAAVDQLAVEAFDDQCTPANPRYPLIDDFKQLYLNAFYGETK